MEIKSLLFENISPKQIVFKNSFWLYFGNILSKFFRFFLVVYAARILGPLNYGTFNYVVYLTGLFFMFSELGIGPLLIRESQKNEFEKNKTIPISFLIKLLLIAIPSIIATVVYFYTKDPLVKNIYFIFLAVVIFNNLRDFLLSLAQAHNRMEYNSAVLIIEAATTTIFGLLFLFKTQSLFYFTLAYLIGSIASFISVLALTFKYLPAFRFWVFDWSYAKQLFVFSLPFAFGSIVGFLLAADVVMIKWLKSAELVGQYSVGARVISLLFIIPAVFTTALYPIFSKFYQDKSKLLNILKGSTSYILMLALPLLFGGLFLSNRIIVGFFGSQYNLGVLSFKILLIAVPFYFLTTMLDYLLIALNYQVKNMIYTAVAAVSNIAFNLFLITKFSIYGAAISTVLSQFINLALTYRLSKKIIGGGLLKGYSVLKFISASLLMSGALYFLNPLMISTWIIIIFGAIIYFMSLYWLRESHFINFARLVKSNI